MELSSESVGPKAGPVASAGVSSVGGEALRPVTRVLVLGASRSGIAAAVALKRLGYKVTLSDSSDPAALPGVDQALDAGALLVTEGQLASDWPNPDLVIKSPGIPAEAVPVRMAVERGIPVWSELELAYVLLPNPFLAVTGTNGKTTTTALLGHLLAVAGRPVRVLGNIGVAATSVVGAVGPDEELVVEVSSFQLEDIHRFCPKVGVFLNLTPDHLDRHGTLERYLECKARLFMNQGPQEVAVLNLADPAVAGLGERLAARADGPQIVYFSVDPVTSADGARALRSTAEVSKPDAWVEGGFLILEQQALLPVKEIQLPGRHNLENCLAAATAAAARGVHREAIAEGLRSFTGVAHRLERVGVVRGVTYVNDSKATNVDAALTALNAYPERVHLILGGRDKASDYRPLAARCVKTCKGVYLIGEAAPLIRQAFTEANNEHSLSRPPIEECGDLDRAVRMASQRAVSGDVVLLAPACASFDQYRNYEERGDHFRSLVQALAERAP